MQFTGSTYPGGAKPRPQKNSFCLVLLREDGDDNDASGRAARGIWRSAPHDSDAIRATNASRGSCWFVMQLHKLLLSNMYYITSFFSFLCLFHHTPTAVLPLYITHISFIERKIYTLRLRLTTGPALSSTGSSTCTSYSDCHCSCTAGIRRCCSALCCTAGIRRCSTASVRRCSANVRWSSTSGCHKHGSPYIYTSGSPYIYTSGSPYIYATGSPYIYATGKCFCCGCRCRSWRDCQRNGSNGHGTPV